MRLIWKGLRAVTVETLGVVVVVWLLFAAAGWTFDSAGGNTRDQAAEVWRWMGSAIESLKPTMAQHDRDRYVQQRLEHYSRLYGKAGKQFLQQSLSRLAPDSEPSDEAADSDGRLLGSL